jgi:hypothetical protein
MLSVFAVNPKKSNTKERAISIAGGLFAKTSMSVLIAKLFTSSFKKGMTNSKVTCFNKRWVKLQNLGSYYIPELNINSEQGV